METNGFFPCFYETVKLFEDRKKYVMGKKIKEWNSSAEFKKTITEASYE
jgi:hypothetical protein